MAMLFGIIVALVLLLTGAIFPILHFGLWTLVVVLTIVLVCWIFLKTIGVVLRPLGLIGSDVVEAIRGDGYPKPDDPDYEHYLDWANRIGEFSRYTEWSKVKSVLAERRGSDAEREA
jgi:hypothetical protein